MLVIKLDIIKEDLGIEFMILTHLVISYQPLSKVKRKIICGCFDLADFNDDQKHYVNFFSQQNC